VKWGALRWVLWPLLAALLTLLACGFAAPTYTARTVLAPRLSPPSWATQIQGPPQLPTLRLYGALLQSRRLNERIALRFGLQQVYRQASLEATLARLAQNTRFGSINGLLAIEVDDAYPWRAADMANQYAIELRGLLDELRVERAQAGVKALQQDLSLAQRQLKDAQQWLQSRGIDAASLRLDRNLVIGEQVALQQAGREAALKLQGLRHGLRDSSPAVQAQLATVATLRRLQREAQAPQRPAAVDGRSYAEAWRELQRLERWQRTLRLQLAAAETAAGHLDDALAVVDRAEMPQRRGGPPALLLMLAAAGLSVLVLMARRRGFTPRPAQSSRYSPAR
jgi:hypothetical protein